MVVNCATPDKTKGFVILVADIRVCQYKIGTIKVTVAIVDYNILLQSHIK